MFYTSCCIHQLPWGLFLLCPCCSWCLLILAAQPVFCDGSWVGGVDRRHTFRLQIHSVVFICHPKRKNTWTKKETYRQPLHLFFLSRNSHFTSLEEIHILNWGARVFFVLSYVTVVSPVNIVIITVEPVIITPEIIKQHVATLPPPVSTLLAELPPPIAPSPLGWRRSWRGLGSEEDSSHHGSIHRGPDALPVPADVTWPGGMAAHWQRRKRENSGSNPVSLKQISASGCSVCLLLNSCLLFLDFAFCLIHSYLTVTLPPILTLSVVACFGLMIYFPTI